MGIDSHIVETEQCQERPSVGGRPWDAGVQVGKNLKEKEMVNVRLSPKA